MNQHISSLWKLLASCCLIWAAAFAVGCDNDSGNMSSGGDDQPDLADTRQSIAQHVADNHILPAYAQLQQSAQSLLDAWSVFANAPDVDGLSSVQGALKVLWLDWQDAAIYQMGPTETNALRSALNLYPTDVNKIENNITSGSFTIGSISNQGAEGLPALDYLLHGQDANNTLELMQQDPARIAYAEALIREVYDRTLLVEEGWRTNTFLEQFTSEQATGTDVGSALGLLVNAIDLHFQRFLRDGKVAIPAGVRSAGIPRPTAVEALYAGYSKELLIRAMQAYQDLFEGKGVNGNSGTSIYAYLESIDQPGLVTDFKAAFTATDNRIDPLAENFRDQIEVDEMPLVEVFLTLQEIVTLIKSDMVSVIGITITNQDNDGD